MFVLLLFLSFYGIAQRHVYVLFCYSESPRSYFYASNKKGGEVIIGHFIFDKKDIRDCPFNSFTFYKYKYERSVIDVKVDSLKPMVSTDWIVSQPDSVLISFFQGKDIYVIPQDSIKNGKSKAYRVTYSPCEIE
jgi:hypothetical protein